MNFFSRIRVYDIFDIAIISILVYYVILFLKGTKAIQLLKGIFILFIVMFFAQIFHLNTVNFILEKVFTIGLIALVIIFQPELRNMLRKLGTEQLLPFSTIHPPEINQLLETVKYFSENTIGSIIAMERTTPLGNYVESGCKIDGIIDKRLLISIFAPNNPLHDGAVIIQHNRISAAGCILPVETQLVSSIWGTRHLSALKLSEETDALVIVTSEEKRKISLAQEGKIYEDIEVETLREKIEKTFQPRE